MNLNPIKANMTEIIMHDHKGNAVIVLFSYKTPVASLTTKDGVTTLSKTSKHWSATTTRHINGWLQKFGSSKVTDKAQEFFDQLIQEVA